MVNGKRYIGSSKSIDERLNAHKAKLVRGAHHSIALQRAWDKHGEDAFVMQPLAILEQTELLPTEQRLLDQMFDTGEENYNVARFAKAVMKGRKHTAETKAKMSESRMGRVTSDETKEKLRNKKLGVKLSQEHCIAIRRGKVFVSPETRAKMSAARMGKPPANKGIRQQFCKRGHEQVGKNVYHDKRRNKFDCAACREIATIAYVARKRKR